MDKTLLERALAMPPSERTAFAELILASIDHEEDEVKQAWINEVKDMKLNITIELWQKGDWYLAKSPELDFIAQGKTVEEAKDNLVEVIQIQFQEMEEMGTLKDYLTECRFEVKDDTISPMNEIIGFEKSTLQIV